jgi:DNA modification methylase
MDTGPMTVRILTGDALTVLRTLPDASVNCCVTSPPYYGLRDYGMEGQIGLEETPDAYVAKMVAVLSEVRRVLRDDGTLWLNIGDSYAGSGKGGNPEAGKQATNRGSQSVGVLYGTGKTPVEAAVTNVTRKAFRAGAGRADGVVDERGQRNRNGLGPVSGIKAKDLIGIPWMLAFALRADGWYLRKDIIWHKPNPMPESVRDRPTSAHEYLFLLAKSSVYHYDADAIAEDAIYSGLTGQDESGFKNPANFAGKHSGESPRGEKADKQRGHSRRHAGFNDRWDQMEKSEQCSGKRNKRSVWTIATKPFAEAHFATMAPELAETCIKAGCPIGGTVLDPFGGAGTTGLMADRLGRNATLIELNPAYVEIARKRLSDDAGMFAEVA